MFAMASIAKSTSVHSKRENYAGSQNHIKKEKETLWYWVP
jgi:hypothetical protein